ncbi:DUF2239 family protein [Lysobacter enzymogenes]|uniref:DUF2239 family protein n=1 Tax=Lysobacter enzymogenes TaxID=69 RepID=A0AAU9AT11_LYSEN|nr:DUF2239 family protein [Lysobacter enzymogenes]BAV98345.1 conserved hypothetical protein [Lysobacter enzymogenes]
MNPAPALAYTAFAGQRLLARGRLAEVAVAVHAAAARGGDAELLVFDDRTGQQVDLHLGGDAAAVAERYRESADQSAADAADDAPPENEAPRGRGRPRLGVTAREVTLLPRQWDWLAAQPGGASVTLRKLIDQARKRGEAGTRQRLAREAAYRCLNALAGNAAGAEEATRALFAGDRDGFAGRIDAWPADVRDYLLALADGAFPGADDESESGATAA